MAFPASHTDMRCQQFEIGAIVIEVDNMPILRRVAGGAIGAQLSLMRIVRRMTGGTILRRCFEIGKGMGIGVTLFTLYRNMLAGQFKSKLVMSKMLTELIDAVVTIDTGGSIHSDMRSHEFGIPFTMTGQTDIDIENGDIRLMTISAKERFFLRLELVGGQHVSRKLMRVPPPIQYGEQGGWSVMLLVTIKAFRSGIDPIHSAVLGHHIPHLSQDILVTIHTAVVHRFVPPGSRMTEATIPGDLGMGGDTAKHLSLDGIQGTRAEHAPAARESESRNGKRRDQRGDNTGARQTSQSICSHSLL